MIRLSTNAKSTLWFPIHESRVQTIVRVCARADLETCLLLAEAYGRVRAPALELDALTRALGDPS